MGVGINRPGRRLVWHLLLSGQFALLVGDVFFRNHALIFGVGAPSPSLANVFYVAAYPLVIATLVFMISNRAPGRDRSSLLDATIVSAGVGVLAWVFVVEPYTKDGSKPLFERFFSVVYQLLALLVFAVLVRLVTTFKERVSSYRMLALGVFCFVIADITYGALELAGSYRTGIIVEIGLQVLRQACRQVRARQDELPEGSSPLTLNANLSARQFRGPGLVEGIEGVLEETGLRPRSLKLEVTENVAMEDVDAALVTLRRLKDLGVRFAIDDFGTGYSSLSYLRRFPVDYLKIDRPSSGALRKTPESAAIVATTVSLAHSLGLVVTAEGVETEAQVARLRALGCDLARGYHFSKPLPAAPISSARLWPKNRAFDRRTRRGWSAVAHRCGPDGPS